MISYELYKILHIITLFLVLVALGAVGTNAEIAGRKSFKVSLGIVSFLIFVAGMGLIARLGFKHGEAFPAWILTKMIAWALFNILFIILYKVKKIEMKLFVMAMCFGVLFTAVYTAITKLA